MCVEESGRCSCRARAASPGRERLMDALAVVVLLVWATSALFMYAIDVGLLGR